MSQPWVRLYCPKCEKYLGEVKEGSECFCNTCSKWVKAERGDEKEWGKASNTTKEN